MNLADAATTTTVTDRGGAAARGVSADPPVWARWPADTAEPVGELRTGGLLRAAAKGAPHTVAIRRGHAHRVTGAHRGANSRSSTARPTATSADGSSPSGSTSDGTTPDNSRSATACTYARDADPALLATGRLDSRGTPSPPAAFVRFSTPNGLAVMTEMPGYRRVENDGGLATGARGQFLHPGCGLPGAVLLGPKQSKLASIRLSRSSRPSSDRPMRSATTSTGKRRARS